MKKTSLFFISKLVLVGFVHSSEPSNSNRIFRSSTDYPTNSNILVGKGLGSIFQKSTTRFSYACILALILLFSFSKTNAQSSIIGNPIKIGNIEVAQYDFRKIPWIDANNSCMSLGDGWRLPTIDELKILYQNRESIGNFKWDSYWSSTKGNIVIAWRLNFGDGMAYDRDNTDNTACVRAVRNSIINTTKQAGNASNSSGLDSNFQKTTTEGLLNTVVVKYDEVQSKVSSNAPNIKWVKLNNKFGFVNSDNFLITPIKYDKIGDDLTFFLFNEEFNEYGLCNVMVLNKWGLVDSNGVEVVAPKYDRQLNFKEGLALAIEQEKGVKVIDVKGNVRIDFSEAKYSGITSFGGLFKEGVMEVKYNGSWIYIDSNGVLTTNKFRTSAANSNPINLLGRVYTKSASNTNTTTIEFSYSSTGRSVNVANALGRQFQTDLYFTYKIDGNVLVITYENNAGTEKYTIDENSATLVSTHLQGYVDGKWGQIYWKREK